MPRSTLYAASVFRNAIVRLQETHVATRLDRWMTGIVVALLFSFGFITGRWTSLTSGATPIVFQEAPNSASSSASPEELRALVAGAEEDTPASPRPRNKPQGSPAPPVRRGLGPPPRPTTRQVNGAFVASVNGKKYYGPDCPEVRRINEENKLWFDSAEEAKDAGFEPSACVLKRP